MKYRIVEIYESGVIYYILQIRRYFIWWTVKDRDWYPYLGYNSKRKRTFRSQDAAFNHYQKYCHKKTKNIVQQGGN